MVKKLTLNEIKKVTFEVLLYFDHFCKQNNIKYFLSNGTLLGAVKYKGFIPWDDDIDVFVPRKDYDRLIREFKDTDKYKLFTNSREPNYRYPYAKLCDMTTRKEEVNINNGVELGLDIDIFPLDFFPNNIEVAKKQVIKSKQLINKLNFAKLKFNHGKNIIRTIVKNICILGTRCIGYQKYINEINKLVEAGTDNIVMNYMGCAIWPVYGESEIIPAEVFASGIEVEFEGKMFWAPKEYDIYLRSLYGNYEKDPPIERQKTHHNYLAYKL